jgi:drug/metabolite transporter (DMT)-like permease
MLVMVLWGATPIITRLALDDLEPLVVATLRTVIGGLCAIPLLIRARHPLPKAVESRRLLAISAATGFVVFPILFTLGQHRTSALHGVMILAALPIFTGLYAALVARRVPRRTWVVGCTIALAGEAILIGARSGAGGSATLRGDLLVLASALAVSAGYVAGAMLPSRGLSSSGTTFWGILLGAVVVLPLLGVILVRDGAPHADATSWASVVVLAVITSIVGYVGWYWALDRGGITRIATFQFLQPLSGLVLAASVLDERVTASVVVGGAAIVCGVVIAQRT